MDLFAELKKDNGYHLTFDNGVEDCPLRSVKDMQKELLGTTHDKAYDANNGLVVVRLNDNSIVTAVSNQYGLSPLQTASRSEMRRICIEQPYAVKHYNRMMSG